MNGHEHGGTGHTINRFSGAIRECDPNEMTAAMLHGRRVLIRTGVYGYKWGDYVYVAKGQGRNDKQT